MRTFASGSRSDAAGSTTRGDAAGDVDQYEDRRHGRLFRLTASGLATTGVAGMLSGVAVAAYFKEAAAYRNKKCVVLICGGNPSPAVAALLDSKVGG